MTLLLAITLLLGSLLQVPVVPEPPVCRVVPMDPEPPISCIRTASNAEICANQGVPGYPVMRCVYVPYLEAP